MTSANKMVLIAAGILAAVLLIGQVVLGQLILAGQPSPGLLKAHQHSGYTSVLVSLLYVAFSLAAIAKLPTKPS